MGSWATGNRYLNQTEMENNATLVNAFLSERGWTRNAIAGILGNMQVESTINPGIWQDLDATNQNGGFGLVQWTPSTNFTIWAAEHNREYNDGYSQLEWIDTVTDDFGQWIKTSEYNMSFEEFKKSTATPSYLASAFLKNFERAGVEKEAIRRSNAEAWYTYLNGNENDPGIQFTPRLTSDGIEGSFYYYEKNPFYLAGYGMPNCTCYAWGRFWEIGDHSGQGQNTPVLPRGDGGTWFEDAKNKGYYAVGQTPKLGAVACWKEPGEAGHVAIVEKIDENGNITTSNSGYNSTFFYIKDVKKSDGYNYGNYVFQGFIYNPYIYVGGSAYIKKRSRYKFLLFS